MKLEERTFTDMKKACFPESKQYEQGPVAECAGTGERVVDCKVGALRWPSQRFQCLSEQSGLSVVGSRFIIEGLEWVGCGTREEQEWETKMFLRLLFKLISFDG